MRHDLTSPSRDQTLAPPALGQSQPPDQAGKSHLLNHCSSKHRAVFKYLQKYAVFLPLEFLMTPFKNTSAFICNMPTLLNAVFSAHKGPHNHSGLKL